MTTPDAITQHIIEAGYTVTCVSAWGSTGTFYQAHISSVKGLTQATLDTRFRFSALECCGFGHDGAGDYMIVKVREEKVR